MFVLRPGDAHCFPTGGTRSRTWRWNGTRFTAGAWKHTGPGGGAQPVTHLEFRSPTGKLTCEMGDSSGKPAFLVFCRSQTRALSVTLVPSGHITVCRGSAGSPCIGQPSTNAPALAYGRQRTVGRFRCVSMPTGMRCTVIRSGKGFLISSTDVQRVP
jgi:hypothetical protein